MSESAFLFVLLLAHFLFFSLSFLFGMDMSFYFLIFLSLFDIYSHYPGADRLLSFQIQSLKTVLSYLQTLFLPSPPIPPYTQPSDPKGTPFSINCLMSVSQQNFPQSNTLQWFLCFVVSALLFDKRGTGSWSPFNKRLLKSEVLCITTLTLAYKNFTIFWLQIRKRLCVFLTKASLFNFTDL